MKALYDYDPYEDNLNPCPDAGLHFQYGDILAIVNQDDPNWWQARLAEDTNAAYGPAKLIPSIELEEKRKAFVKPEADYAAKIGLCGTLVRRKKHKEIFKSKENHAFDKAELAMYEEVTLMKPFRRKTLVLIGASGVARRSLKQKILNADPDQFASPLPHTSRPKRAEEDSGMRYWFVDREDMEYSIRNHEFLEYGELKGNLYGTRLDSVRAIIDEGRTAVLDPSPRSLKLLRNSSEFMPFIVFLAAPGLDEMQHVYNNLRVSNAMSVANTNLSTFERNSSIRQSSKRAQTLASMSSLYVEEDVMKNLEESARLQRAFSNYFDLVVVNESHEQTFRQVMDAWLALSVMDQWVPSTWVYS
jgi:guanylate kinase